MIEVTNLFSHARCGNYSLCYQVHYVARMTICHTGIQGVFRSSRSLKANFVCIPSIFFLYLGGYRYQKLSINEIPIRDSGLRNGV